MNTLHVMSISLFGGILAFAAQAAAPAPDKSATPTGATPAAPPATTAAQPAKATAPAKEQIAVVETSQGSFKIKFFKDKAPKTCENFITLAKKGYYNGLCFHRVIAGFMIQGGCPKGDGTGGPGYTIKAEFNDTKHVPGIVSMARSNDPNSAGSQFFICVASPSHLDGQYTAFGKVIEGYDVVEKIGNVKCGGPQGSTPVEKVVIKKITIE